MVYMEPQTGGESEGDLVTSQPVTMTSVTSRSVENTEDMKDDGTVVRTRVTTTQKVHVRTVSIALKL